MVNAYTSIVDANSIGEQTVLDAYDMAVDWELRSMPLFRNAATVKKRPQDLNNPGPLVRFTMLDYLPVASPNSDAHEYNPKDARALPEARYIDVALKEFSEVVIPTLQLRTFSFTNVDQVVAQTLAATLADDVDTRVGDVLYAGTQVVYSAAGAPDTTGPTNTVGDADHFSSRLARFVSAKLRGNSAMPLGDTGEFVAIVHPDVEHDIRGETAAAGWRIVHEYSAAGNIWSGTIGIYEGLAYVTSPRARLATDGETADVTYKTIVMGAQALAEAVAIEPHSTLGPVTDPHNRHRPFGYHGIAGWGRYREECLYRVVSGSSISTTALV